MNSSVGFKNANCITHSYHLKIIPRIHTRTSTLETQVLVGRIWNTTEEESTRFHNFMCQTPTTQHTKPTRLQMVSLI